MDGKQEISEVKEAAGNLLATLIDAKDEWRHGRISTESLQRTVRTIRYRAQRFEQGKPLSAAAVVILTGD